MILFNVRAHVRRVAPFALALSLGVSAFGASYEAQAGERRYAAHSSRGHSNRHSSTSHKSLRHYRRRGMRVVAGGTRHRFRRLQAAFVTLGGVGSPVAPAIDVVPLRTLSMIIKVSAAQKRLGTIRAARRTATSASAAAFATGYTIVSKSSETSGWHMDSSPVETSVINNYTDDAADDLPIVYFND